MKKILNTALVLFLACSCFTAMAVDHKAEDARELIKTTAEEVISYIKTNRSDLEQDSSQLFLLVEEKLVPIIDFKRVSRWILGKHWRKASEFQKKKFTDEFKKLLINTYSTALMKISDEKLTYPPIKGEAKDGKVGVKSVITLPDGRRFNVQYRMHHKDFNWKIYDISVDGVSLVSTYRASFKTEIRKVGLDGLLANLTNKNKELSL